MAQRRSSKRRGSARDQSLADRFRAWSDAITRAVGTPWAMLAALAVVVVWALTGPIFGFSDTWQLVINTGTTIVTFLMVFAIQTSQNRESTALHIKIDELIRAHPSARNRLMSEEQASKAEIEDDEREMLDRAAHGDEDERHYRADASRRRKQTQRDRR
jgi:low affinity Fe/Cu permease